jgi:microcystin-dependent protein
VTKVDLQYDLVNYTPASAAPPQANFARLEQHVNQELIERDGTVAMRAQLQLVGDPVAALDAAPKQYVDQILPVGIIMMYGGTVVPPGGRWALCNGAELQSTDYPALFAVLGVAYGGSAGRFNLPNLTDKFPRGAAPGATGGSADNVVVAHTHDISHTHAGASTGTVSADHSHGYGASTVGANARHNHNINIGEVYRYNPFSPIGYHGPGSAGNGSPFDIYNTNHDSGVDNQDHGHAFSGQTGGISANHSHGFNTPGHSGPSASTGVAATNTNLPPYLGVTYIIRVN